MARLQMIKGGSSETLGMGLADYIWVTPDGEILFKKKIILVGKDAKNEPVPIIQRWGVAEGTYRTSNGCQGPRTKILSPAFYLPDPTRPQPSYIVLCETRDENDMSQGWRSKLRKAQRDRGSSAKLVWFGFEQVYALETGSPTDEDHVPPDLAERQFLTSERHLGACFDAGLLIHSAWNPPTFPTWEFKVGVRGFSQDLDPDPPSALVVVDHLMVAQYLMEKIGAEKGLHPIWLRQSIFVSTAELREPGRDQYVQAALLKQRLAKENRVLRNVPHPTNGGCQCVEVALSKFTNPYKLALDVLEVVWPLDVGNDISPTDENEDEDQE